MKVMLFGKASKKMNKFSPSKIEELVRGLNFGIVSKNSDLIITYGGDGTLLSAERQNPGVPKLPLRNNDICKKCPRHQDEVILKKLAEGKLKLKEYKKLETTVFYKKFYALNDFVLRNSDPTHTIRFKMTVPSHPGLDPGPINKLLIGDGIVISTAFGSTGYFKSITGKAFEEGFGVAFNNTTEKVNPLNLGDNDSVAFQLIRGKATLSFDNSPEIFNVDEGSELIFELSEKTAKIYEDTSLRCPNCKVIRG